ncbi:unnamed protein product, partial [Phaeothamnion confervicola]
TGQRRAAARGKECVQPRYATGSLPEGKLSLIEQLHFPACVRRALFLCVCHTGRTAVIAAASPVAVSSLDIIGAAAPATVSSLGATAPPAVATVPTDAIPAAAVAPCLLDDSRRASTSSSLSAPIFWPTVRCTRAILDGKRIREPNGAAEEDCSNLAPKRRAG